MCAGLLFLAGFLILLLKEDGSMKIVLWAAIAMIIVSIMWLWDDVREPAQADTDV